MPSKLLIAGLLSAAAIPTSLWIVDSDRRGPTYGLSETSPESPRSQPVVSEPRSVQPAAQLPAASPPPVSQNTPLAVTGPDETVDPEPAENTRKSEVAEPVTAQPDHDGDGETLYLTIVGDKTYRQRGLVSAGPPSMGELNDRAVSGSSFGSFDTAPPTGASPTYVATSAAVPAGPISGAGASTATSTGSGANVPAAKTAASPNGAGSQARGTAGGEATATPVAVSPSVDEQQWVDDRPWPKPGCPWTLPAGTDQAMADTYRAQYSCRYLSTCSFDTQTCTYYYQGG